MSVLPVVGRELRASARKKRVYWGRFGAAATAIVVVLWVWVTFGPGVASMRARQIFGSLSVMAFVYAIVAGVWLTADAISEEKREGTLGLLFLTDLKGYDVVLGKVFATSLHAFYGLLAIFPVLAIPLLLGGLTVGDFWRMVLVLVNTLLFSVCLGILVSSFSHYERKAQMGTLGLILLLTGGLPLFGVWLGRARWMPVFTFLYPSPGFAFGLSFEDEYKRQPDHFWTSIYAIAGIWLLALLLAGIVARRTWQDRPRIGFRMRVHENLQKWRGGSPRTRQRYRTKLLNVNPFYWLSSRDRLQPFYVLGLLLLSAVIWANLFFKYRSDMTDPVSCFFTGFLLQTVIKLWIASEAGKRFAEDRKNGALELTLSTPAGVRDILDGQFLSLLRQFGWGCAIVICADLALMLLGRRGVGQATGGWALMWGAGLIVFVTDIFVLSAVSMWLGLTAKRAGRAFGLTVFYTLVLPWLIFIGFITLILISDAMHGETSNVLVGLWFVISVVTDVVLFGWAAGNLTKRFREVATQRFDSPRN